jgi:hypothetical protein
MRANVRMTQRCGALALPLSWKINNYYTFWVCVCSLMQHAVRVRRIVLPSVACLTVQYLFTLSHKRHGFRKKKTILNIKCVFWFSLQLLYETFLIPRRTERDIFTNVRRLFRKKCPTLFFSHSRIKIAMWKLRGSNASVYCAHVCKYTVVRQMAPL